MTDLAIQQPAARQSARLDQTAAPDDLPRGTNTFGLLMLSLVLLLFAIAYFETASKLVGVWSANDMYSYGFLVPPISGVLIWMQRDKLKTIPRAPALGVGGLVCGVGLVLLFTGRVSNINVIEYFSLIVTISGLTVLLLGVPMFRALLFPIAYLLSMVPAWEVVTARLHPYLQEYSAAVGVGALKLFGIPVLKDGFFIELPSVRLEVAEACSGVNYLIAVFCVGIPATHLFVRDWWKRGMIVGTAVMIALLSNGFRVATVSLLAYYEIRGANGDVHGPFSLLRSVFVSGIGFIALFGLISRFADADGTADQRPSAPHEPLRGSATWLQPAPLFVALLLLGSSIGLVAQHDVIAVPTATDLGTFPAQLGRWRWLGPASPSSGLAMLNFDETLSRSYGAPDGSELNIFIGYLSEQSADRELADSRMQALLRGRAQRQASLALAEGALVKEIVVVEGDQSSLMTYWYLVNGQIVAEDYQAKIHTIWNALVNRKSHGAIVAVTQRLPGQESVERARDRIRDFLEALMAESTVYFPRS